MEGANLQLAVFVGLSFVAAGCVKGVVGLGLPTVAVGLLVLAMPPAQAVALLLVPSLVTNIWQLGAGAHLAALLLRLWPMLLGICVGTAGAAAIGLHGGQIGRTALGVALILYAALGLAQIRFAVGRRTEEVLGPLVGVATGAMTVASGVFVIPAVPYLQALALEKDELVQAMGLSFTVSTLALGLALFGIGVLEIAGLAGSAAALLPALAGMALGQRLRHRLPAETFRRLFFAALFALGVHLALQAN